MRFIAWMIFSTDTRPGNNSIHASFTKTAIKIFFTWQHGGIYFPETNCNWLFDCDNEQRVGWRLVFCCRATAAYSCASQAQGVCTACADAVHQFGNSGVSSEIRPAAVLFGHNELPDWWAGPRRLGTTSTLINQAQFWIIQHIFTPKETERERKGGNMVWPRGKEWNEKKEERAGQRWEIAQVKKCWKLGQDDGKMKRDGWSWGVWFFLTWVI